MPFFGTGKSMILKRVVLSWIKGSILLRGEVGREGVRWGGEKGRGRSSPQCMAAALKQVNYTGRST